MVKKCVRIYIEGGAPGKTADSDFRRGWKKFLDELHQTARSQGYHSLEVVRGKGRGKAYDSFKHHKLVHPDDLCVLLADSETQVPEGSRVWDIVSQRDGDHWERPVWATERHLYLMAYFVETWLLTDQEALEKFFKKGFDARRLPQTNLESRTKQEVDEALRVATKGSYRHGQANEIIGDVRPASVKTLSHGRRLFDTLGKLIRGESEA